MVKPGVALALLVGMASAGAVEVEDNCAMCHEAPPVPADHVEVDVVSLDQCTMCHEPAIGDPFFSAVHTGHIEMGFDCSDCHGDNVPAKERMQELLEQ